MHDFISLNSQLFPASDTKLSAVSSAALYGKGIFTTIAIYDSNPFLWEKHWRRLTENAEKTGVALSGFDEQRVAESVKEILIKNKVSDGRCRITFFDESPAKIWEGETRRKSSLLIQTSGNREVRHNAAITVSPFRVNSTSPLSGIKSCNYLDNLLALENAALLGYAEAIRLNERGELASGCMSNIFWLKNEQLFTPSLETGCLAGTTREFILERREVFEVGEALATLEGADAIFLTSSGIGVSQIGKFQDKNLAPELHELTQIIKF